MKLNIIIWRLESSRLLASKLKHVHFVLEPFGVSQGQLDMEPNLTSGCRPRFISEERDFNFLGS